MAMENAKREAAELRLGTAHEYYAHALRVGDDDGAQRARQDIEAAQRDLAAASPMSPETRAALESGIEAMSRQLGQHANGEPSLEVTQQASAMVARTLAFEPEQVALDMLEALDADTSIRALVRAVQLERVAVGETGREQLEALGADYARDLADLDHSIASAAIELQHLENEYDLRAAKPWPWPARGTFPVTYGFLALMLLLTFWAQLSVNMDAFASLPIQIGLAAALATLGFLTGRAFGMRSSPQVDYARFIGATLSLIVPPVVGFLAAHQSRSSLLVGVAYMLVGYLLLTQCAAFGYVSASSRKDMRLEMTEVRQRHAELLERRVALLGMYVARGNMLMMATRRADAEHVRNAILRTAALADVLPPTTLPLEQPDWLTQAIAELSRTRNVPLRPMSEAFAA